MAFVLIFVVSVVFTLSDAAINIVGGNSFSAYVGGNVIIPWEYDFETDMSIVQWSFENDSGTFSIMTRLSAQTADVVGGFNVEYNNNGNITLTNVQLANSGTYTCFVTYKAISGHPTVTGTAELVVTKKPEGGDGDDDNTGKIVGGVLGGVGVLCVCIVGGYFIWKWKNKTENNTQHEIPSNTKK